MDLTEAIEARFSCRNFSDKELSISIINEILEAARYAPSPKNRQPWRFLVLRHGQKQEFEDLLKISEDPQMYMSPQSEKLKEWNSWEATFRAIKESDTLIVIFNRYPSNYVMNTTNMLFDLTNVQAIGAAIQNMLLKATAMGIGSLWICDIFSHYHKICSHYYPEGQLIAAVALGYPKVMPSSHSTRKSLTELIISEV